MLHKEISIPRLAQVRDIFCFCCLTGLAFTDVQQLKAEHLVVDIHGKIWIRKARQKTKNMCNIPLLDEAQKILDRYKDHPYCQTHGVLLPVCSNQKMNSYLKELADICDIPKNLSTHCARHTLLKYLLNNRYLQMSANGQLTIWGRTIFSNLLKIASLKRALFCTSKI